MNTTFLRLAMAEFLFVAITIVLTLGYLLYQIRRTSNEKAELADDIFIRNPFYLDDYFIGF